MQKTIEKLEKDNLDVPDELRERAKPRFGMDEVKEEENEGEEKQNNPRRAEEAVDKKRKINKNIKPI